MLAALYMQMCLINYVLISYFLAIILHFLQYTLWIVSSSLNPHGHISNVYQKSMKACGWTL